MKAGATYVALDALVLKDQHEQRRQTHLKLKEWESDLINKKPVEKYTFFFLSSTFILRSFLQEKWMKIFFR